MNQNKTTTTAVTTKQCKHLDYTRGKREFRIVSNYYIQFRTFNKCNDCDAKLISYWTDITDTVDDLVINVIENDPEICDYEFEEVDEQTYQEQFGTEE